MTDIARVRIELIGTGVIGPSVLTLYTAGLGGDLTVAARDWLDAQKANITTDVSYVFPSGGDMIDDATGNIVGTWTGGTVLPLAGTGGGAYAKGVGYMVRWLTAGVVNSRHVKGRSFIVPVVGSVFTSDGGVDPTLGAAIATASNDLVSDLGGNLRVWSRPAPGRAGSSHAVTSASLSYVTAWLKTRKM